MIKKIGIKNFKAFRDYNEIEIRPITIFIGPNSSGKSSLIKFLSFLQPKNSLIGSGRFSLEDICNKGNTFCKNDLPIEVKIEFEKGTRTLSGKYEFKKDQIKGIISPISNHASNSSNNMDKIDGTQISFCNWEHHITNWKTIRETTIQKINSDFSDEVTTLNNYLVNNKSKHYSNFFYFLDEILLWIFEGNYDDEAYLAFYGDFFDIDISHTSDAESGIGAISINGARKNMKRDLDTFSLRSENIEGLYELFSDLEIKLRAGQIKDCKDTFFIIFSRMLNNPLFTEQKIMTVVEMLCVTICSTILENVCAYYESDYRKMVKSINFDVKMDFQTFINNKPLRAFPRNYYSKTELIENFELMNYKNELDINYSELIDQVNKMLKTLEINYSFILKSIEHENLNETLFVVKIKDIITEEEYNFNEVGFGLSQIIPIIFNICVNKAPYSETVFLVEQPEIHLHPKQQVNLSNLFFENLGVWQGRQYGGSEDQDDKSPLDLEFSNTNTPIIGYSRNIMNSFVIETHSEHLVRGFQVLVSEGKLLPGDIGIYYIDRNNEGVSTIKNLELNEYGLFKEEFPAGFFDNSYNLTKKLLFGGKRI